MTECLDPVSALSAAVARVLRAARHPQEGLGPEESETFAVHALLYGLDAMLTAMRRRDADAFRRHRELAEAVLRAIDEDRGCGPH